MEDGKKEGHLQRLKDAFLSGTKESLQAESILELLLTYAIPQKDVEPLAERLIAQFGNLQNILEGGIDDLTAVDGLKTHSAILIKLTDWIRRHYPTGSMEQATKRPNRRQQALFDSVPRPQETAQLSPPDKTKRGHREMRRIGTGLFGKAVLKEAIELLPVLPATDSLDGLRQFLRAHLHFSAEEYAISFSINSPRLMEEYDRPMNKSAPVNWSSSTHGV